MSRLAIPASSRLARAFSLVSSRTSPTVFSSGRSSTMLRLLAGLLIRRLAEGKAADQQPGQGRLAGAALAGDGDRGGHWVGLRLMSSPAWRPDRRRAGELMRRR